MPPLRWVGRGDYGGGDEDHEHLWQGFTDKASAAREARCYGTSIPAATEARCHGTGFGRHGPSSDDDDGELYVLGIRAVKRSRCPRSHGSGSRRLKSAGSANHAVRRKLRAVLQVAAAG